MNIETKTLIPNKEWILKEKNQKIGSILKNKKGFNFLKKGEKIFLKNKQEVKNFFGIELPESFIKEQNFSSNIYIIYDYPCSSKPFESLYNLKKKLPLFSKSSKSKSKYCAGYYLIKFRKGWVKSFCPKLITLERYQYHGPYKTEHQMKLVLSTLNKHESN